MYMPKDLNTSLALAVQWFEWAWEEDRQGLPQEVQKLEDYMGEEAIQTHDNIRGVEDHEEV